MEDIPHSDYSILLLTPGGSLNEKYLHMLMYLNARSPAGGTVLIMKTLVGGAVLEVVQHWVQRWTLNVCSLAPVPVFSLYFLCVDENVISWFLDSVTTLSCLFHAFPAITTLSI